MSPRFVSLFLLSLFAVATAGPALSQTPREDAIWARTATGPLTLDGVLDEAEWALAESTTIDYGVDNGIPGSGWKVEAGFNPTDLTHATLKFLVVGNQLYLGARVDDQSIGGSVEFNRFDGFLMAIKDHLDSGPAKPPAEYFYSWWYPENPADPQPTGQLPAFAGRWATWPPGSERDSTQVANWDAMTVVRGTTNSDTVPDQGYTVEMRFNLTPMGYDVTQPAGDIVEWNISIYDTDWFWPLNVTSFSTSRVWWQSPWGNTAWYNEVRVFARPDVTTNSGSLPSLDPEVVIPPLGSDPVIDGQLSDAVWSDPDIYSIDMRYGDDALRSTYPGVGQYRAGQYQPPVNGGEAFVIDPGDATVKMFYKDDMLYLGFDVRDQVVQFYPAVDRWDGFLVHIDDRVELGGDNQHLGHRISFQVNSDGTALPQDYLNTLIQNGQAQVALALKAGTSVDTLGTSADTGYTAELAIDLKGLGYPPGLGDHLLFFGIDMLDGDSFTPMTDSYGTRTWWYREYEGDCCAAWAYLQPSPVAADPILPVGQGYAFVRAFPNPAKTSTIQFSMPDANQVIVEVYNVAGRRVDRQDLHVQSAGTHEYIWNSDGRAGGIYLYRLQMIDPQSGRVRASLTGKTVLLK
jgi:hypothetical protein